MREWGLYARMIGVAVLLGALYTGFAVVLAVYVTELAAAAVVVGLLSCVQVFFGAKIALRSMGASVVTAEEAPQLHATVQRLAQQAGIPAPRVAVADTQLPNAFAAGRSQNNAVVCVTTGLLDSLDDEELAGVVAHELAHIQNRDMVIMTVASAITTMAFFVVRWGWLVNSDNNTPAPFWVAIVASLFVWAASTLVLRLLSRYREFAADRGAARITGNPTALASALLTIDGRMDAVPEKDLREHAGESALMFANVSTRFTALLSTHPSVDKRVDALRTLGQQQERQ